MTTKTKYYQLKQKSLVQAEELTWDNWNAVCDMLGDLMGENKIRGVAVTDTDIVREQPDSEAHRIGLWIPAKPSAYVAVEGDYVLKDISGHISIMKPNVFKAQYESAGW